MQLQDLSYKPNNQIVDLNLKRVGNIKLSVEVFSLENIYTIPAYKREKDLFTSTSLVWGDTEISKGKVELLVNEKQDKTIFDVNASLDKPIRSVKVRLDNLPLGKLISLTSEDVDITEYGSLFNYPEGWRHLSHPLLVFRLNNRKFLYIRCLDKEVNLKHFFIKKVGDSMRVDIVQEVNGVNLCKKFDVPNIEIGICDTKAEIYKKQSKFMKDTYQLELFSKSSIVPSWLKDISLVVIMHMESFTGHIFHTYEQAYEDVKKICSMIDGKHILVYFAGWEGRYYYKYGDYTPDERLGGAKALKECIKNIHKLGCKTMAMYGMNIANKNVPGVNKIYKDAEFESISGAKYHNGSVDWEGAHHYDFNELVNLNIANKKWADYLFDQIKQVTKTYDFDGAFLDIAACFTNDKNDYLYKGVVDFCNRLRTIKNDFLVSGEAFYDGLAKAMPLFQSGHTDGELHYHDRISEDVFTPYVREFAHLCLGDPSRGSSGVHELGTNTIWKTPLRKGILPTISLVENSLEETKKVAAIIEEAKEYIKEYL